MTPGPTLRAVVKARLERAGCAPRHRFGQNFMVDRGALARLVAAAGDLDGATVLEVGPGTGHLTRALLAAGARVVAVEIDHGLAAIVAEDFASEIVAGRLELIEGDVLAAKTRLEPRVVTALGDAPWNLVANLPYDVALPVLLDCLALDHPPRRLVATVQKEAAERLCSQPGSDAWGATAAVAQAAGQGGIVALLPPRCFHPQPRVDSAVLSWSMTTALPAGYPAFCRRCFAYRRKLVVRALRDAGYQRDQAEAARDAAGLAADTRFEQVPVAGLLALHRFVTGAHP